MATYTERGKRVRVQIRLHGVKDGATFPNKTAARAWATAREAEIIAGARGMVVKGKTVAGMFDRYIREVCPTHRGARWEELRLKLLLRAWGIPGRAVDAVSPDDVGALRDKRLQSVGKSTVRRELVLLGSVFEVARREWRWCAANPVRDVRKPPAGQSRNRTIQPREYRAILRAMKYRPGQNPVTKTQWVGAAWCLAIRSGMRAGEILGLTWDHVDLARKVAVLPVTKNGTAREVPLFPRALRILEVLSAVRFAADEARTGPVFPITPDALDALYRKARRAAGIAGLTFHDSRHTASTMLARRLTALELARTFGHQDLRMVMVYYNESASNIANRVTPSARAPTR